MGDTVDTEVDMVDEDDMCFFMYFCICNRASAVVRGEIADAAEDTCLSSNKDESDGDCRSEVRDERLGKQLRADVMEITDSISKLESRVSRVRVGGTPL